MALNIATAATDKVDFGSGSSLDNLTAWTAFTWYKPGAFGAFYKLFGKNGAGAKRVYYFGNAGGAFPASIVAEVAYSSTAIFYRFDTAITASAWNFVATTFDAGAATNDFLRCYSGTLTSTAVSRSLGYNIDPSGTRTDDASESVHLGSAKVEDPGQLGDYAWFALYNSRLTATQIINHQYKIGKPLYAGCVLFSHLGLDGVGTQYDWSGNGNHGTVTGATVTNHAPVPWGVPPWIVQPPAGVGALSINVTDALTLGETTGELLPNLFLATSEGLTLAEALTMHLGVQVGVSDALTLGEVLTLGQESNISVADALTLGEAIVLDLPLGVSVADGLTLGEALALLLPELFVGLAEGVTLGETVTLTFTTAGELSVTVTDALTLGETTTLLLPNLFANVTDALTIGEAVGLLLPELFASVAEGFTLGEAIAIVFGGLEISVADALTLGESSSLLVPELFASASDAMTLGEAFGLLLPELHLGVTDGMTLGEIASVIIGNTRTINVSEGFTLGEVVLLSIFVAAAARTYTVPAETRTLEIGAENRTYTPGAA